MATVPIEHLQVVKGEEALTLYQWHTDTAMHWFCGTCGIYTHHRRRANTNQYGVNIGCIVDLNPRDLEPVEWVDGINHPSDQ